MKTWCLAGVLTFTLISSVAFGKSLVCSLSVFGHSINDTQAIDLPFYPAGHVDHSFMIEGRSFRAIVHPWQTEHGVYNDSIYLMSLSLVNDQGPFATTRDSLGKRMSNSRVNYVSINHPGEGTVALTPAFITALKKMEKWGQAPFDGIDRGTLDASYFFNHDGMETAQQAIDDGLVEHLEVLFFWIEDTCELVQ